MPTFSSEALLAVLNAHEPATDQKWCIALSGGLDSMVLLHAMAALRAQRPHWSLRALHVDHQLQAQSADWARHCRSAAEQLGISCAVRPVRLVNIDRQGVEAAARHARYEAFAEVLQPGEIVLTAHHADDQLETLLIALMRGSGVAGLAAMPAKTLFGAGRHWRPLLGFTRAELREWALRTGVAFVDDPSNRDTRFDRNFLRREIIPLLQSRWPSAAATVSRSARHLAEADALLDECADRDLQSAVKGACLSVARLRELDAPRRRLLLRRWIQSHGLLRPSTRTLAAMEQDLLQAADDRVPCIRWPGAQVYRHRDWLYAEAGFAKPAALALSWPSNTELHLPGDIGILSLASETDGADLQGLRIETQRLAAVLSVRFRCGGERIRLPGETQHRELKKLLQASNILPWWRGRLPLIYSGEQLVAVADLWISDEFAAAAKENAGRLVWRRRHQINAV